MPIENIGSRAISKVDVNLVQKNNKKKSADKERNAIEWITLFRRNWHIFADMVLGIKLKPFQQVMLYLMGVSDIFFAICSRGLSRMQIKFIKGVFTLAKLFNQRTKTVYN